MDDAPAKDAASKKDVRIVGTFGMHDEQFGYAVRKEDKDRLEKVNQALTKLMATPEWNELINKYELNK
jgi:polar amino acid transport system substrate-binding protein